MADAFAIAAALTLAYLLQATVRGWWIQDRRDKAHTAHRFEPQLKGGESDDDQRLGLVRGGSLAGGKGSLTGSPCEFCGEIGGHAGWCPVVSFGVVKLMARRPGKRDACFVVLLVGSSLFVGLGYLMSEAVRWIA